MKVNILYALLALLLLSSCRFEYPFFVKSDLPIDRSIIGTWQLVDKSGQTNPDAKERYLILPYSKTEYLILSGTGTGEQAAYYRGYPIELDNHNAVQMEFIGTSTGPIETQTMDRFSLIAYDFHNGLLEVYMMNPKLISKDTHSIRDLQTELSKVADDPDLFSDMLRLKRDTSNY